MRLIDADKLIEELGIEERCSECQYVDGISCAGNFVDACMAIFDAPTVKTEGDTISRQAAIDAVMETEPYLGAENIVYQRTDDVIANINKLPSAQPERKTGKWIEHNPHKWGLGIKYECSECGYEVDCEEPNFCPNCGADMRGETWEH